MCYVCLVDPFVEIIGHCFDEADGKRGLTLCVMTVLSEMFHWSVPSETYSRICAQQVFCINNDYFPS